MKYLIIALALMISGAGYAQSVLPLRADTVRIEKVGGSGELQIRNATRDSIGVMVNIGGGRTRFMKVKKSGDTAIIIGLDTISIAGKVTVQQAINNGNILNKHDTLLNLVQLDILGLLTPDGRVGTRFNGLDGSLEIIGHGAAASTSLIFRDLTNPTQSSQISSLDGSNLDIGSFPDPVFGQSHFRANPNGAEMSHGLFPNNSKITINIDSTIIDPGISSLLGLLIRNLPAGGTADDSVLVITSQDQVKRRAAAEWGKNFFNTDFTAQEDRYHDMNGRELGLQNASIIQMQSVFNDTTSLVEVAAGAVITPAATGLPNGAYSQWRVTDNATVQSSTLYLGTRGAALQLYKPSEGFSARLELRKDTSVIDPGTGYFTIKNLPGNAATSPNDSVYIKRSGVMQLLPASVLGGGGGGITTLNGLTDATQTFQTGTSGPDFGISSSAGVHTFNIPDASSTARGLMTTGTQTFNGNKTFANSLTTSGNMTIASTGSYVISGRASIRSSTSANIQLGDNAGTAFGLLQFGGTTSAFPALQRSGTGLIVRLADNSANAPLTAGSLTLTTALGVANGGTGQTTANAAFNALAPSQTSNGGKVLTTDGTNTSWGPVVQSGIYNPTFSNLGTGVSSVTASGSRVTYTRVGNVVTITGRVNPVFSSGVTGDTREFNMSLPAGMTANFTSFQDAVGVANCGWANTYAPFRTATVYSDSINDNIQFSVMIGEEGFGNLNGVFFTIAFEVQ